MKKKSIVFLSFTGGKTMREDDTWKARATKVQRLLDDLPALTPTPENSQEIEFRKAVIKLCHQIQDAEDSGGQLVWSPLV